MKPHLLLVDDDPDILDALADVLADDYRVTRAAHGALALQQLEAAEAQASLPDAVVADLMMPVMDGAELLRRMAARALRVPVVLVSASPELERVGRELGAAAWLEKPFSVPDLLDTLTRVLGARAPAA